MSPFLLSFVAESFMVSRLPVFFMTLLYSLYVHVFMNYYVIKRLLYVRFL